jgi:hypothetical protein
MKEFIIISNILSIFDEHSIIYGHPLKLQALPTEKY